MPAKTANERRLKDAFMQLLYSYVTNANNEVYRLTGYCEKCPFYDDRQNLQICSKDLNDRFDFDTCAEAILDWYMGDAN